MAEGYVKRIFATQASQREKSYKVRSASIKLRRLGIQNQMVNNSDSRPSEYERWYKDNLDSNIKFLSSN